MAGQKNLVGRQDDHVDACDWAEGDHNSHTKTASSNQSRVNRDTSLKIVAFFEDLLVRSDKPIKSGSPNYMQVLNYFHNSRHFAQV